MDNVKPATKVVDEVFSSAVDAKEHARILRKLDWHILPLVSLLYLFSFLDRVNIANARIAGMATDLDLVGLRYNIAAAIFFVPYSFLQVLSNIVLKLYRPSRWLPAIMVVWGLIMTLMCLVKTYHQLLVARFFLGVAEAGLFPGISYYLTLWYPRAAQAQRLALFISAAVIGGAFGGLLAYGIVKMEGTGGLHGWQWIFCLEGLGTMTLALVAPFFMYDGPATASFLTEAEKRYIVELLKRDSQGLATHFSAQFVLQAFRDYKIYLQCILYIGLAVPAYGTALFLPSIINDLGFSAANAQLLSVPPFVIAAITIVLFGIYSDRRHIRGPFVIVGALVCMMGYIVLYTQTSPGISYFGTVLATMGASPCIPVDLAWIISNAGGEVKRAVALALVNGFGNLGGICASFIFFDPPRYHVGLGTIIAFLISSISLTLLVMWDCNRLNKQKELMCHEGGIVDDRNGEFSELGDNSPLFRYTL